MLYLFFWFSFFFFTSHYLILSFIFIFIKTFSNVLDPSVRLDNKYCGGWLNSNASLISRFFSNFFYIFIILLSFPVLSISSQLDISYSLFYVLIFSLFCFDIELETHEQKRQSKHQLSEEKSNRKETKRKHKTNIFFI